MLDMAQTTSTEAEVRVEDHGSIVIVQPLTRETRTWLQTHTDGTWFGGGLAVEPRYVCALLDGLADEGYRIDTGDAHFYESSGAC